MKKIGLFLMGLVLGCSTLNAQEPGKLNKILNFTCEKTVNVFSSASETAASYMIFDAYNLDKIFLKIFGNEDYNKVMVLMIKNTPEDLELYLPEGITTFRNPCSSSTTYSFYTPERIDINLDQDEKFILINQVGKTLISSGSALFTDRSCSYYWFGTSFLYDYDYEPILDDSLQELLVFNPDTSTLQQVMGDQDGYLLIQRNYNTTGMTSRYIYLDNALEGEKYEELTENWEDSAFESLSTHDFVVELENDSKVLSSLEVPEIKITKTGIQGAGSSIFTTVVEDDMTAPVVSIEETQLYQPEFIEVTSTEDCKIFLVPENTDKDIMTICEACLDSIEAVNNTAVNIPLGGMDNGTYWLYAIDISGNISEPVAFVLMGVGIEQIHAEELRIYPSPTYSLLTVETITADLVHIEITSLNGKLIISGEMEGTTHQLDLSSFQKGVYFITVRSRDLVTTRKIVKL